MNREELRQRVISDCLVNNKISTAKIKPSYLKKLGLYEHIQEYYSNGFDIKFHSVSDVVWCIVNSIQQPPRCETCGNFTRRSKEIPGLFFRRFCSQKCVIKDDKWRESVKNRDEISASEKRKATMLKKYGYTTNSQRPEIKVSVGKKTTNRYLTKEIQEKLNDKEFLKEYYVKKKYGLYELADIIGVDSTTLSKALQNKNIHIRKNSGGSKVEREVVSFLYSIGLQENDIVRQSKRIIKPYELDIYLPEKQLAIEFNGLRWHNEFLKPDRLYHRNKWKKCEELGIQLLSIFEDEWKFDREQVEHFIKSKLGIFEKRIYARNCEIKQIEISIAREFIRKYHLQSGRGLNISKAYGMFYQEELLGVVSFGKHHRQNHQEMVLNRLCFKFDVQIVGGASKLVKKSLEISGYETVKTWSDNRWSTGQIYQECGFEFSNDVPVSYDYVIAPFDQRRIPKQSMQKKRLKDCPSNVTAQEYLAGLGYIPIYDCGKKAWIWNKKRGTEVPLVRS